MSDTEEKKKSSRLLGFLSWLALAPITAWCIGAILLGGGSSGGITFLRWVLAGAFFVLLISGFAKLGFRRGRVPAYILCLFVALWFFRIRASNDREWAPDQVRLAWAEIDGPLVTLRDIRNFHYRSPSDWDEAWYDKTFDTRELEGVDFFEVHFSDVKQVGHTMLSFRFAGDQYVTFSVEVRREVGESYGVLRGIYRQFEVMYVVGDENDLVKLRTHHRNNEVYLHPAKSAPEGERALFLDMCKRLNELREKPAFYNTLLSNCTTNLVSHWEYVNGEELPLDRRWVLAGRADEFAFELGLIATSGTFEEVRARNFISAKALDCDGKLFSSCIRK